MDPIIWTIAILFSMYDWFNRINPLINGINPLPDGRIRVLVGQLVARRPQIALPRRLPIG